MSDEPFRMPRHAERSAPRERSTPVPEPLEEPQPKEPPKPPVHHAASVSSRPVRSRDVKEGKSFKKFLIPAGIIALIIVAFMIVSALWPKGHNESGTISGNKYQAVSFTDGQLYFGKLTVLNDEYMKLTDVYYLQPQADETGKTSTAQSSAASNQNFKLVKFTDVVYGPEDEMTIPKRQILFYENINPQGKVAQLIEQYKKSNQ